MLGEKEALLFNISIKSKKFKQKLYFHLHKQFKFFDQILQVVAIVDKKLKIFNLIFLL